MAKKIFLAANAADATVVTHSGIFHCDEVFGTALLGKIFPEVRVLRTFKVPEDLSADVIVYDIGGGQFDHHQRGFEECRENGTKYSSFGLLWRRFWPEILAGIDHPDQVAEAVDRLLVEGVDALDNGQGKRGSAMSVSEAISGFNPTWESSESADSRFLEAVAFAEVVFDNTLRTAIAQIRAKVGVEEAIEASSDGIMVLENYMPWQEEVYASSNPKAGGLLYVVFPSNRGGYMVQAVPAGSPDSFDQRLPLPEAWAGLRGAEMAEVSGVKSANFCHPARFCAGADTLEGALALAQKALVVKEA